MTAPVFKQCHDLWVCRDADGVLHKTKITRSFAQDDTLCWMQVCTACCPHVQHETVNRDVGRGAARLPSIKLERVYPWSMSVEIVDYCIREAPTCVVCVAASNVFGDYGAGG